MPRCLVDPTLERKTVDAFAFPLGVYPVEPIVPTPGFVDQFEPADGAEPFLNGPEADEWEEWPDRFMFDVLLTAPRVPSLVRFLVSMLPPRVYPILDVMGRDAYREVDPYIAYDSVGLDRVVEGIRDYGPWLFEDGLVGFGAMSVDPFIYVFVDEHKIVTARVQLDLKERVERLLRAYDLEQVEEIRGADAASHEHRSVIVAPDDKPHMLAPDEILETLRDSWLLQLNIAGDTNIDDDGKELGTTGWQCLVRLAPASSEDEDPQAPDRTRYAEVILTADSLDEAEDMAADAIAGVLENVEGEPEPIQCDRVTPATLAEILGRPSSETLSENAVHALRWLGEGGPGGSPAS